MTRDSRYPVGLVVMLAVLSWSAAAHAQFIRGFDLFRTGQYCKAREAWLASEKSGDSTSPFGLAELYARGLCVKQNERLASRWYLTAAQRGNPRARAEIGLRYAYGKGVQPNSLKAYVWMSTSLASAGGWEKDFVTTVDKNLLVVERTMTPEQQQRAKAIVAEFKKTYRLPREFNSLD
jgi:hypothetical protein